MVVGMTARPPTVSVALRAVRSSFLASPRADILSGLVVALALIPEAIAFSIIAGVDPKVGLYASFSIAVITAFAGGRPGMISAATAAMAVVLASLVRDHGIEYMFAATVLTGVIQVGVGFARVGVLMRFVSRSVVTGFLNALAILIFLAQVPEMRDVTYLTYFVIGGGLAIIYGLPRVTSAVPSPLVAIVVLTSLSIGFGWDVRTVGDMGELPTSLPAFLVPQVPLNLETLRIILPYALTLSMVGLLESLMTASVIDDLTHTSSDKNRECVGQGVANFATGFLGGMAGCAMIGQSIINYRSGGRSRLSTLVAGVVLLFLILVLGPWVKQIPMGALVAVMIMVSISTFSWKSLRSLRTTPRTSSVVTFATVAVVVYTHDLAQGVLVGVLLSGLFFAWKVARDLRVEAYDSEDGEERRYEVHGQVFFASAPAFRSAFDLQAVPPRVVIDASRAHLWDVTSVGALDAVVLDLRRLGADVDVVGMNETTAAFVRTHALHDKAGASAPVGH